MTKYIEIDLTAGLEDQGSGAFDAEKVAEAEITNLELARFLAGKLNPIAQLVGPLLRDGAGFAVVSRGDSLSIIGLAPASETPHDPQA